MTTRLSPRAARQIRGAAIKASILGMGLGTFITFTCRPELRLDIADGRLVLGHEMRRTLNAMQQRFRREGHTEFAYVWVAENPGDDNPHVHMLTNYQVAKSGFADFARWLEGLWGHGWAHVERIRCPERAGQYLLKAVRYLGKGEDDEQGRVYGNRYGVSVNIRPRYWRLPLHDSPEAALHLAVLTDSVVEQPEWTGDLCLTRYGLVFQAGTSLERIGAVVEALESAELLSAGELQVVPSSGQHAPVRSFPWQSDA